MKKNYDIKCNSLNTLTIESHKMIIPTSVLPLLTDTINLYEITVLSYNPKVVPIGVCSKIISKKILYTEIACELFHFRCEITGIIYILSYITLGIIQ